MIAAIYTRVSKEAENPDYAPTSQSVETQEAGARAFITSRGWSLDPAHVYTDDGKSGALFIGRPSFQRMLTDAVAGAFDVVVFFDLDRFGRHAQKSMEALNALADAGVEVYDFSTGQRVDVESFEGETSTYIKARMAQQYREQIRKHTKAAMRRKAELGWATGNRIFGYTNERISKGHVELRIQLAEAEIIRDIYTRCANGQGARTIAAALNRAGVPKPRAQQGRRDGWSASTIRAVLTRPLYRGEIVYGRTAKAYNRELRKVYKGTTREKGQIPKPEETWIRLPANEALRIIDPDLAARVDARLGDRRSRYLAAVAKNDGRAPQKAHGRYLLSGGMLLCPTCGGHFEARKYPWRLREKGGHPGHVYICSTRRRKPGVCGNTLALPISETDDTVLGILEGEVLGSRWIRELLDLVKTAPDETTYLQTERSRLQTELDRLVGSIAAGVPADAVASLIRQHSAAISKLDARLRIPRVPSLDHERLRAALEQRAEQWKSDLRAEPQVARLVLRRIVGPLTLWDESERPEWIRWTAEPTTGLLDGLAPVPTGLAQEGGSTLQVASLRGHAIHDVTSFQGIWRSDRRAA